MAALAFLSDFSTLKRQLFIQVNKVTPSYCWFFPPPQSLCYTFPFEILVFKPWFLVFLYLSFVLLIKSKRRNILSCIHLPAAYNISIFHLPIVISQGSNPKPLLPIPLPAAGTISHKAIDFHLTFSPISSRATRLSSQQCVLVPTDFFRFLVQLMRSRR